MMSHLRLIFAISMLFGIAVRLHATIELKVGVGEKFTTIQQAVDAVPPVLDQPYVISIGAGTYVETVLITGKLTTPVNNLTLTASQDEFPTVDARRQDRAAITLQKQNNVVIENLVLRQSFGYGCLYLNQSHHNTIRRCIIRDNSRYDGIMLSSSTFNLMEHNVLYGNSRSGIFLNNTSQENTIRFNILARNGVGVEMATKYSSQPVHLNYNAFFQNKRGVSAGLARGAQDIETDPDFENMEDFSLSGSSLVARWGRSGEATPAMPQAILSSASNLPQAPKSFFYIDMSSVANRSLQDDKSGDLQGGWTDQGDYDLRHAPKGPQTFGGIPYLMPADAMKKSVVILAAEFSKAFPSSVENIPVGKMAQELNFLQGIAWATGDAVIRYVVHYADGRTVEIPIRRLGEVGDWFNPIPVSNASIAWKAPHPLHPEAVLGLYSYTWVNPYPYIQIVSIDIHSTKKATPIVVAITGKEVDASLQVKVNLFTDGSQAGNCNQPVALSLDCMARGERSVQMVLQVFNESGKSVYESPSQTLKLKPGLSEKQILKWQPPRQEATEIYRFVATVGDKTKNLGSAELYMTVQGEKSTKQPAPVLPIQVRGDAPIGGSNLPYACEIQPLRQVRRGKAPQRIDAKIFDQLKENGGTEAHLILWWGYLEPEPYKYDFSSLEWALEQCKRVGLKASISVWMADHIVPLFVQDENMLDQFGAPFLDGRGREKIVSLHPSLWGPKTREHYRKLIQTICRQYLDDPIVVQWGFIYQHTEVVIHDRPGEPPIIYDYSQWSQQAYRDYLRKIRGWSLEELNTRYGTKYLSWSEVRQPLPKKGLDVSLIWTDFQDYRVYSARDSFEFTFKAVREIDPSGKKRLFTFNPNFSEDLCDKYGVISDYTSSEIPYCLDRFKASRFSGNRPLIVEPMTIPPGAYEIGAGFFNALAAPAQGYFWIGTVNELFSTDTVGAHRFKSYRDAWVEVSESSPIPAEMALWRSEDTALATDKVFFNFPRYWTGSNYDYLIQLFQFNSFNYQPVFDVFFQMTGSRMPRTFKLIVDSDSLVMREAALEGLLGQVRQGATWVIQPETGRYCRENPVPEKSLTVRLGWPLAAGPSWKPVATEPETVQVAAGQPILGGVPLRLLERYPIEKLSGGDLIKATDGTSVARILTLGKGRIVLMAGNVDWKDESALGVVNALTKACNVTSPIRAVSGVRAALMKKQADYYVLLFNEEATKFVTTPVHLEIPAGNYELVNVTDSMSRVGVTKGEKWQQGYSITLAPLEFRVYRISPVTNAKKE